MKFSISRQCVILLTSAGLILSGNSMLSNVKNVKNPVKGVNISYENNNIDWKNISKDYDYVLINVGDGYKVDEAFEDNYKNARKNHLDVGIVIKNEIGARDYMDTSDITIMAERRYSATKISQLLGKKIKYPVYLNIDYGETPIEEALPKEYANALLNRYEMIMAHNKLVPGVYSSSEVYEYLKSNVDDFDNRFTVMLYNEDSELVNQLLTDDNVVMVNSHVKDESSVKNSEGYSDLVVSKINYNDNTSTKVSFAIIGLEALGLGGANIYSKKKKAKEKKIENTVYI